jgi:hypothetical protein
VVVVEQVVRAAGEMVVQEQVLLKILRQAVWVLVMGVAAPLVPAMQVLVVAVVAILVVLVVAVVPVV